MSDMAIVKFSGDLGPAAKALVEKVSAGLGRVYEPTHTKRIAKAEAKAEMIRAESELAVSDLQRRTIRRMLDEEVRNQENIEAIVDGAFPLLEDGSDPSGVDDDWIANFFEKCRIVSDTDMQSIWSRILAGESNTPGHFSRRAISLVGDLEKRDAEIFTSLCRFTVTMGYSMPVVLNYTDAIYANAGVAFPDLKHLDALGLIDFNSASTFSRLNLPARGMIAYFDRSLLLEFSEDATSNEVDTGHTIFTRAGAELVEITHAVPVPGFLEYVQEVWQRTDGLTLRLEP